MNIEDRLWEYIDGMCNDAENAEINRLIHSDRQWKSKYEELLALQHLIESSELEQPSMRFTQNVMEEISKLYIAPATKTYINKKVIFGIGGFFITMIVGLLIYSFAQVNWNEGGENPAVSNLGNVNWSAFLNNTYMNIFMMVNTVLALMLVDKYLSRKRQTWKDRKI